MNATHAKIIIIAFILATFFGGWSAHKQYAERTECNCTHPHTTK